MTNLPTKWCIEINNISRPYISKYNNNTLNFTYTYKYLKSDGNFGGWSIKKPDSEYPEITLEQFQKWVLNEEPKKLIGYKAPMDLFGGKVKKGHLYTQKYSDCGLSYYPDGNTYQDALDGTGKVPKEIVETWEAVYEDEFKVGDIVFATELTSKGWMENTTERVFKLVKEPTQYINGMLWTVDNLNGKSLGGLHAKFRKATPQEIEAATKIEIGGYEVEFKQNSVKINGHLYGLTDLKELKKFMENHKDQVKSLNCGCRGEYKVDLEMIEKIIERFK